MFYFIISVVILWFIFILYKSKSKFKSILNIKSQYTTKYTAFMQELRIFVSCFKSWEAFKTMLYGQEEITESEVNKPVEPELTYLQKIQKEKARIEQQLTELNEESSGIDILKRKARIETMAENNPEDMHPRAFELCMLIDKKDAEIRKSNKEKQAFLKKMHKKPPMSALGKRYQPVQTNQA